MNVKANHKYLCDYNPNAEPNCIMYWDDNNICGWAMGDSLPYRNFKFEHNLE